MPTPELMTWVASQRRWKKMYKGGMFYISARKLGCPESKEGSILAANAWWTKKRAELDAVSLPVPRTPRPGEDIAAALLGIASDWPTALASFFRQLASVLPSFGQEPTADPPQTITEESAATVLRQAMADLLGKVIIDGTPLPAELAKNLPPARVHQLETSIKGVRGEPAAEPGRTVKAHLDSWYERQVHLEASGTLKARTVVRSKQFLDRFVEFVGDSADISSIDASVLENFYRYCLSKAAERRSNPKDGWSMATAVKTFAKARSWIRWLAENGTVPLPANIASRSFRFGSILKKIETWTTPEVQRVIGAATGRLKLALLLFVNCGFVQVDASELRDEEVDWSEGRIIRRRSKTADKESAPVVNYKLWPLTFELLQKYRSGQERVILTESGRPFVRKEMAEGKVQNVDVFRTNFLHLQKRLKFNGLLKQLRKTGASKLSEHPVYGRFAQLYLGHSPSSMADRHYITPPQQLFDEAIRWLGQQFGFCE